MMKAYGALVLMVFLNTLGQLLVKRGAVKIVLRNGFAALVRSMLNLYLLLGCASVVLAPLLYMYALSILDLSVGYSFTGLTYVSVVLSGHLLLHERITLYHIAGALVILAGLTIWNIT
jgi:drug/metabolite transporter (DMT)-like permease